jgi:hypothetical protein
MKFRAIFLTKISHDEKNRMAGIRWGIHDGKKFLRFDFWTTSFRITGMR